MLTLQIELPLLQLELQLRHRTLQLFVAALFALELLLQIPDFLPGQLELVLDILEVGQLLIRLELLAALLLELLLDLARALLLLLKEELELVYFALHQSVQLCGLDQLLVLPAEGAPQSLEFLRQRLNLVLALRQLVVLLVQFLSALKGVFLELLYDPLFFSQLTGQILLPRFLSLHVPR